MITVPWRLDSTDPAVREHVVKGGTVVPLAFWLERCLDAVTTLQGEAPRELHGLLLHRPIVLGSGTSIDVQFTGARERAAGRFEVREAGPTTASASPGPSLLEGAWRNETEGGATSPLAGAGRPLTGNAFYDAASRAGFRYGPVFRRIARIETSGGSWRADIRPLEEWHPPSTRRTAAWDALLQGAAVLAADGGQACWIPFRIETIRVQPDAAVESMVRASGEWHREDTPGAAHRVADIFAFAAGAASPGLELLGVHYRVIDRLPGLAPEAHRGEAAAPVATGRKGEALARLRAADPVARRAMLIHFIEENLLEILCWPPSRRAELAAGFVAIGMDSLSAVDLQYRLQTALEFALPVGKGFESTSVEDLADSLLQKQLRLD